MLRLGVCNASYKWNERKSCCVPYTARVFQEQMHGMLNRTKFSPINLQDTETAAKNGFVLRLWDIMNIMNICRVNYTFCVIFVCIISKMQCMFIKMPCSLGFYTQSSFYVWSAFCILHFIPSLQSRTCYNEHNFMTTQFMLYGFFLGSKVYKNNYNKVDRFLKP